MLALKEPLQPEDYKFARYAATEGSSKVCVPQKRHSSALRVFPCVDGEPLRLAHIYDLGGDEAGYSKGSKATASKSCGCCG